MNDRELADRIVALGVGSMLSAKNKHGVYVRSYPWYEVNDDEFMAGSTKKSASHFVRDWRVAGAMMEKVINKDNREDNGNYDIQTHHESGKYWTMIDSNHGWANEGVQNESLPRAINEACVEALE